MYLVLLSCDISVGCVIGMELIDADLVIGCLKSLFTTFNFYLRTHKRLGSKVLRHIIDGEVKGVEPHMFDFVVSHVSTIWKLKVLVQVVEGRTDSLYVEYVLFLD